MPPTGSNRDARGRIETQIKRVGDWGVYARVFSQCYKMRRLISTTEFKPALYREGVSQSKMQSSKKYLKMEKTLDFAAKSSVLESKTNLIH